MSEEKPILKPAIAGCFTDWCSLHLPWAGALGLQMAAPQVRWKHADEIFTWEVKCPLPETARDSFAGGGFLEGLWNHDLAECFLLDQSTGHYSEYNLGPGGAWWAAHFTGPRVRMIPQPQAGAWGIRASVAWSSHGWSGRMEMPLPPLVSPALNFTAIVQTSDVRHFYSLAPLGGRLPDFHRPQEWLPQEFAH